MMFRFLLVAQALRNINQYFQVEATEEDFWDTPVEALNYVTETQEAPEIEAWFIINPQKLKKQYINSHEALIVSESEKSSMIEAFSILRNYSKSLPNNASLQERLIIAKSHLPPVFFDSPAASGECKIIPFDMMR